MSLTAGVTATEIQTSTGWDISQEEVITIDYVFSDVEWVTADVVNCNEVFLRVMCEDGMQFNYKVSIFLNCYWIIVQ